MWTLDWKKEKTAFLYDRNQKFVSKFDNHFLGKTKILLHPFRFTYHCSIDIFVYQWSQPRVDFVGGRSYTVRFDKAINSAEVQSDLVAILGNAEAKIFGNDNQLKITTNYKVDVEGAAVDDEIQQLMYGALQTYLPDGTDYDSFVTTSEEKQIGIMSSIKVGPTIADDIKNNSFLAVFGSLIVVFLYILLRFRKWQFSLGAVAAVFHDVLLVLGIFL